MSIALPPGLVVLWVGCEGSSPRSPLTCGQRYVFHGRAGMTESVRVRVRLAEGSGLWCVPFFFSSSGGEIKNEVGAAG